MAVIYISLKYTSENTQCIYLLQNVLALSARTFFVNNKSCISFCIIYYKHYDDTIMGAIASLITSLTVVYSTVHSDADQRKHQSSAWLAFVWGIHRGPVNSPHKWPVPRKMFPFDDVIMKLWDLIHRPCPNFSFSWAESPFEKGCGWIISSRRNLRGDFFYPLPDLRKITWIKFVIMICHHCLWYDSLPETPFTYID